MKKISKSLQTLTRKGYGIQKVENSQQAVENRKAGLSKQTSIEKER